LARSPAYSGLQQALGSSLGVRSSAISGFQQALGSSLGVRSSAISGFGQNDADATHAPPSIRDCRKQPEHGYS
jgi:hypothetical protein